MRILRVIASMDPKSGGPCQGIRNTIQAMHGFGVENEVVCLDSPHADFLGKDNFKIHALGPANNPWAYSSKLVPWLKSHVPNFDAVIVHGIWLYPSYAVYKALNTLKRKSPRKVPWYVMPHGMLDPYFQNAPNRKFKALRNLVYWKLIENRVIRSANAVFFTCEEEMLLARKPFSPYLPKNEVNVGYGIQPPPAETPAMKEAFYEIARIDPSQSFFLFLSRIHPKKGVDHLIKAYIEIHRDATLKEIEIPYLVIAGPGVETSFGKQMVELAAKDQRVKSKIVFPGMLSGDSKWGAFYNCDVFVLPSHQENFGIAVVEALACKKPVLISNKINIWREIMKEKGGLVNENNMEGSKQMMLQWLKMDDGEKITFEEAAYRTYSKYFQIEKNIIKLLQYIQPEFNKNRVSVKSRA